MLVYVTIAVISKQRAGSWFNAMHAVARVVSKCEKAEPEAGTKTLGDAFGVPRGFSRLLLSVSFSSLLPFSWLPLIYSPFHFSWTYATNNCCD
jgi:hypothetical protein